MEVDEDREESGSTLIGKKDQINMEAGEMASVSSRGPPGRKRIAVLASGRGSDFQALIDSCDRGELKCDLALLVCNVPDALAINRARRNGIPYVVIDHRGQTRREFDTMIHKTLKEQRIDLVVLAGFMRILSPWFVKQWPDKIINIHPALLPAFPGAHAHRDALEYGVKLTGLTIHFVDEDVDHGPIIFQYPVEIHDDDTEEALSARVLDEEHRWYPRVIQWIVEGRVKRVGRNVTVDRSDR